MQQLPEPDLFNIPVARGSTPESAAMHRDRAQADEKRFPDVGYLTTRFYPILPDPGYIAEICRANKHLALFFYCHSICNVLVDRNFNILLCNNHPAWFKKTKTCMSKGKGFLNFCTRAMKVFFERNLTLALAGQVRNEEITQQHQNGKKLYWNVHFAPAKDETGQIFGVKIIGENITQSKIQQIKILEQYQQLHDIAWKQSHVLRSPLANLKGLLQLLSVPGDEANIINYINHELDKLDTAVINMSVEMDSYMPTLQSVENG
ncbi:MAG TPA: PAS domain-containing protein [Mucilaginibacter sp.]|nr:PAS domain-containing protein [Mucilaginibacter sp.]